MSETAAPDDEEIVNPVVTAGAVTVAAEQAKRVAVTAAALEQDQAELLFVLSAPPQQAVELLNSALLHPGGLDLSEVSGGGVHAVELLNKEAWGNLYNSGTINPETVREGDTLVGQPFDSPFGFEQEGSVGLAINVAAGAVVAFHDSPITGNRAGRGGRVDKIEAGAVHEFKVKVQVADELLDLLIMGKVIGVTILIAWGHGPDESSTFTPGGLAVIVTFVTPDGNTGYQVRP